MIMPPDQKTDPVRWLLAQPKQVRRNTNVLSMVYYDKAAADKGQNAYKILSTTLPADPKDEVDEHTRDTIQAISVKLHPTVMSNATPDVVLDSELPPSAIIDPTQFLKSARLETTPWYFRSSPIWLLVDGI